MFKKIIPFLAILLIPINAFASSAVNPANTGNVGGFQGTDWIAYTPTFTGWGTATNISFFYRRVGDGIDILGKFTAGTTTATEARMSLPTGLIVDSTKLASIRKVGDSAVSASFTARLYVLAEPSVNYVTFSLESGTVAGLTKQNGDQFSSSQSYALVISNIPIAGWSAGGNGGTNPGARYYASSTAITGSLATIVWTTADWDTNSGMASGVYTCPVVGKYQVNAFLALSGTFVLNNTVSMELQKNGTAQATKTTYLGGAVTNADIGISDIVYCTATTDTIRIQVSSSGTTPAIVSSNVKNWISIQKID